MIGCKRSTYGDDDVLGAIVERLIAGSRIYNGQALMSEVAPALLSHKQPTPVGTSVAQPAQPKSVTFSPSKHLHILIELQTHTSTHCNCAIQTDSSSRSLTSCSTHVSKLPAWSLAVELKHRCTFQINQHSLTLRLRKLLQENRHVAELDDTHRRHELYNSKTPQRQRPSKTLTNKMIDSH